MNRLNIPIICTAGVLACAAALGCTQSADPGAYTPSSMDGSGVGNGVGGGTTGGLTGGTTNGVGGAAASTTLGTTTGTGTGVNATATGTTGAPVDCSARNPGKALIRRLTRFEYNNSVRSLLADDTAPGNSLPAEVLGNGFGNDTADQPVSDFLIEQHSSVAAAVATRTVETPGRLATIAPCYSTVTADTEAACARSFIESFGRRSYRRPLETTEVDELLALERSIRATHSFESSLAGVIEAVLQGPDFLYRPELGVPDTADPSVLRPSGHEMATRLSYLFWGTVPDDALHAAADSGELLTDAGVLAHATRMLADPQTRPVIRFFFDYYLPLNTLTDLSRDAVQFPTFSASIGNLMREETQRFLEYEIFQGSGTWPGALTAPYTFVNEQLANFYGMTGVVGEEFQRVDLDTTKRLGLLTQGGIQAGTTISNYTNPVRRGVFLLRHIMCVDLPDPPESIANEIMPPDPGVAATGRERYSMHSQQPACANCHAVMDPPGFALENFDAVGQWRDQENGVTIDASGQLNMLPAPFNGPVELVTQIAQSELTQNCLAENWLSFGYGRTLDAGDACSTAKVEEAFAQSGYNVQQLLLALTQTDAFLYLSPPEQL